MPQDQHRSIVRKQALTAAQLSPIDTFLQCITACNHRLTFTADGLVQGGNVKFKGGAEGSVHLVQRNTRNLCGGPQFPPWNTEGAGHGGDQQYRYSGVFHE